MKLEIVNKQSLVSAAFRKEFHSCKSSNIPQVSFSVYEFISIKFVFLFTYMNSFVCIICYNTICLSLGGGFI